MPSPIPGWPPHDWSPLASENPLPGDTTVIRATASHYGLVATVIAEHNVALRSVLCGQEVKWKGHAADAYRKSLGTLPPELDKVHDRMARIEQALSKWADKLETHQKAGLAALRKAQAAQAELDKQNKRLADLKPPTDSKDQWAQNTYATDRNTIDMAIQADQEDLGHARSQLERAKTDRDTDGKACANALNAASNDSLKDPDWDNRVHSVWWQQILGFVSAGANLVGIVASLAGILFCWCPPVAGVLEVIGLIAGGVTLAADWIRMALGDQSVTQDTLDLDVVTAVPFGKVFGAMSKWGARTRVLPAVAEAVEKAAKTKDFELISTAFKKGDFGGAAKAIGKAIGDNLWNDPAGLIGAIQTSANVVGSEATGGVDKPEDLWQNLLPKLPDLNALPAEAQT